jgi:hypothetical protein
LAAYRFNLSSDGLEWGWSLLCKLWGGPPAFTHDLLAYTSRVTLTLQSLLTLMCTRKSSVFRTQIWQQLIVDWMALAPRFPLDWTAEKDIPLVLSVLSSIRVCLQQAITRDLCSCCGITIPYLTIWLKYYIDSLWLIIINGD